jgi:hypothetical protein
MKKENFRSHLSPSAAPVGSLHLEMKPDMFGLSPPLARLPTDFVGEAEWAVGVLSIITLAKSSSPLHQVCHALPDLPGVLQADCLFMAALGGSFLLCVTCQHIPVLCSVFQMFVENSCPLKVLSQQVLFNLGEFFCCVI